MSLVVKSLKVNSGGFLVAVEALDVKPGEIVAVMGPSGAGKTTLLHAIAGFLPLDAGTIRVGGVPLEKLPPEKRRMAMVFQSGALFPHLTIRANVEFPLRVRGVGRAERRERAGRWLARLGIPELAERFPHEVSGGQAQRAAFGRALNAEFPVLLLDEPFSALDSATRKQLRLVLRELVRESGVAALLVTHDGEDAAAIADRVLVLRNGAVESFGGVECPELS